MERKHLTEFAKRKASNDGLQHRCKKCQSLMNKKRDYKRWYWTYNRAYAINSKYKLTVEEYENIISKGCEVCSSKERLVLDHNHSTNQVRGCLCHKCNTALGLLDDDVERIKKLIGYLNGEL